MFKVIVAGSRNFHDYTLLSKTLDQLLQNKTDIEIVSGTAAGADVLGEKYAQEKGLALKKFPADWNKFGRAAGYKRNEEMAKYADACVVFWDGESRGTMHMRDLANRYKLALRTVMFKEKR